MTTEDGTILNSYLQHCSYEKNLNSLTLKAYRLDLRQFFVFIEGKSKACLVDRELLKSYTKHLFEEHLKESSIKRKLVCLKAFFGFLEDEGLINPSPFQRLRFSIRMPKRIPEVMNMTDVTALINLARCRARKNSRGSHSRSYLFLLQDSIIIELLFATGMRVKELSNLNVEDIDVTRRIIKVYGKGSKERILPVPNDDVLKLLTSFLGLRSKWQPTTQWLLTNKMNRRMSTQSIRTLIHRYVNQAKLKKRITPHTFRHTIATMLLENGTDIRFVQTFLGHSSILTTQLYTHASEAAQRRAITLNHPRNLLKR